MPGWVASPPRRSPWAGRRRALAGQPVGDRVVAFGRVALDRGRRRHHLGPVGPQQRRLLRRDFVRHDEDALVALDEAAIARPTPVLPEVGSTIVPPGRNQPLRSASSIIRIPIRSLTDPPGLSISSLATSRRGDPGTLGQSRLSRTSGVLPMAEMMSGWIIGTSCGSESQMLTVMTRLGG